MKLFFVFGFIFFFLGMLFFFTGVHNEDLSHNMLILKEKINCDTNSNIELWDETAGMKISYEDSYKTAFMFELVGLGFCCAGSCALGFSQDRKS